MICDCFDNTDRNFPNNAAPTFRGQQVHRPDWLLRLYQKTIFAGVLANIVAHFVRINTWSTNMRYQPGVMDEDDAERFMSSVEQITLWVEGRL